MLKYIPRGQKCEVDNCHEPFKYKLYNTDLYGKKKWIKVCVRHEGLIGSENLKRAGGALKWGSK